MLVSVIITTYKREYKLLRKAIESVKNQSYENIEIIVVNDTPKENFYYKEVGEKIKEYGNLVTYLAKGINKGACFARNSGLKIAKGQAVAFLDDDDLWKEYKIEKQVKILESNKEIPMVTVKFQTIIFNGKNRKIKNIPKMKDSIFSLKKVLKRNVVGGCSAPLIRKGVIDNLNGFDEKMPAAQDYDLWIRIAQVGDIYCIGEPLQEYYIHEGDRISNSSIKKINGYEKLIEKYANVRKNNKEFLMNKYIVIAYHNIKLKKYLKAIEGYKKSLKFRFPTLEFIYYNFKILDELVRVKLRKYNL